MKWGIVVAARTMRAAMALRRPMVLMRSSSLRARWRRRRLQAADAGRSRSRPRLKVFDADAPAGAGAGDGAEIDAALGGDLAHQWACPVNIDAGERGGRRVEPGIGVVRGAGGARHSARDAARLAREGRARRVRAVADEDGTVSVGLWRLPRRLASQPRRW